MDIGALNDDALRPPADDVAPAAATAAAAAAAFKLRPSAMSDRP